MWFKKVVFVRYFPLTKAIYTDLYFEEMIQNNIQVEYLDISRLFSNKGQDNTTFHFAGIIKIATYKELKNYFKKESNCKVLYISIMTYDWRVFRLYRIFTKNRLKLAVFARGIFPTVEADSIRSLKKKITSITIEKIKEYIGNKICVIAKHVGYIKCYDFIFKAGDFGYWALGLGSEIDKKKSKFINVNTVDYDKYLEQISVPLKKKLDYIVFLDQYLPFHPDTEFLNIKTVEQKRYYEEINAFFLKVEQKSGKKILISAHPKAEKYNEFNPYGGRPIFFNQSNELVKMCSFVLTHASTSISYPIIYEKPILLITSNYMNDVLPHFYNIAFAIKKACDATLINIDYAENFILPITINSEKYSDFKYKYLTSVESEMKSSKNILINFLSH